MNGKTKLRAVILKSLAVVHIFRPMEQKAIEKHIEEKLLQKTTCEVISMR